MITGSIVALVTPMLKNGDLDAKNLKKLVEFHIEQGTHAIVAVGTTGESATLSEEEHCQVIQWVVDTVAGRLPVIAGTGSNNTLEAITLSQCAKSLGAVACLSVTPYYNKPTQHGLIQHYRKIADSVDIPQILYNVPGRTGCDMLPETIITLAQHSNIAGIKEATGDLSRIDRIKAECPQDFAIYGGDDATGLGCFRRGGNGVISVTANVAPKAMAEMCVAALAGDYTRAEGIDEKLMGLHRDLFVEANPIPVKWALHKMGLIDNGIRLPLTVLSPQFHDRITQALQMAQLI